MSNGGKQLRELIRERGFKLVAVAKAIEVSYETMRTWTHTAPIDKLFRISNFTGIPFDDIADCFRPDPNSQGQTEPDQN
ncbi:hypothetical protein [Chamaesiphon sp.]|uniref:hypothetical protein n=1 Tax=Chamaesiphon sp. TaxID=2814140 RepID=UPI00359334D3